jgi:hypothetical protein
MGRKSRKSVRKYHRKNSRRKIGGNNEIITGSDVRNELVTLCRHRKWSEYDNLTQRIINDYELRNSFFYHLNNQIQSFSPNSLSCLKRCLIQLRERGIPDSIPFLYYGLCKNNEFEEYEALTQSIIRDYQNGKKEFFIYLDNHIDKLNKQILPCLELSLTRLQEEAIPESMRHLSYITERVPRRKVQTIN